MEKLIVVFHGSKIINKKEIEDFCENLSKLLNKNRNDIKYAFLQFGSPSFRETILECIKENAKTIIIHPLFILEGSHVSKDIPEIISEFKRTYPDIKIISTKHLGLHRKLCEIIKEKIDEVLKTH